MAIKTIFIRGLQTTIPLFLTVVLIVWGISIIESVLRPPLIDIIGPDAYFPGLGFIVGILLIFLIGVAMNIWIAQWLYSIGDRIVKKIPLIKTLYTSLGDLMNFLDTQNAKKQRASPVVIETQWGNMVGFITAEKQLPKGLDEADSVAVYIPMSYQIGGYTLFIPRHRLKPIDLPFERAMSYVLTAGLTGGGTTNDKKSTLLDLPGKSEKEE